MSNRPLDYHTPTVNTRRTLKSLVLVLLGPPISAYGLSEAVINAAALEQGDSSGSRIGAFLFLMLAAGGIVMLTFGILGLFGKIAR